MDLLDTLLGHDHWATAVLLERSRDLTDAQLDQPFDIGHRTLRATFEHMIPNVAFWTELMAGQQPIEYAPAATAVATLIEIHERAYAAFAALARQVRDEQRLGDTYVDHYAVPKTFGGTILMVITHNEGHRVEALHLLERLGVPDLPEVDLGVWDYLAVNS
jgi:uncharacterized damage-inducible protein DinB